MVLLLAITTAKDSLVESKEIKEKKFTYNLEVKEITKQNKTKLINKYKKTFPGVKKIKNYQEYGNITIINIKIGEGKEQKDARILTNTKKFMEVLKWD